MSLARIYSGAAGLGSLIIHKLTDTGGPPASRVSEELDNVIAWAKDSPRCIEVNTSQAGNVGTGLDNLHGFSLPAGSLATDEDYLHLRYTGSFANTEDDKQTRVTMDGQVISSIGAVIDMEGGAWSYDIYIVRTSATTVRASVMCTMVNIRKADGALVATPSGGFVFAQNVTATVSNLNSNAVTLQVLGEGTNNDDVTQNLSIIELRQQ